MVSPVILMIWISAPTMFHVAKIHDCGTLLQAEMRPPLLEMLCPIAFDFGMVTSYFAPERYFAIWVVFFGGLDG